MLGDLDLEDTANTDEFIVRCFRNGEDGSYLTIRFNGVLKFWKKMEESKAQRIFLELFSNGDKKLQELLKE